MINKILLVGYGTITKNVIKNILMNSKINISVWSRNKNFERERCVCSSKLEDIIEGTELIISCVPSVEASYTVWHDKTLSDFLKVNKVYCMEMSTLTYEYTLQWHDYISDFNCKAIESPFTKSRRDDSGRGMSLFIYSEYLIEIREFLKTFAKKQYAFTSKGQPMKFKLIYNAWGAEMLQQFAEMYKVINNELVDKELAYKILSNDGWMSSICSSIMPKIIKESYDDVSFKLKYMKKDVDYARELFERYDSKIFKLIEQKYSAEVNSENEELDFSAIVR